MHPLELVSHIFLWIAVIVLGALVLALARQIGLLYEKTGISGARIMNVGPSIGQAIPEFDATDIQGKKVSLGSERGKRTLMLFISANCASCAHLMPAITKLAREERKNLDVIIAAFGINQEDGKRYSIEHRLNEVIPLIVSNDLALEYKISVVPYGLLIDRSGILRTKGLVNHYQDIESLLNADELGVRSIQEYLKV